MRLPSLQIFRLRYLFSLAALALLVPLAPLAPPRAAAQRVGVDIRAGGGGSRDAYGVDFFYDALAPYGDWVQSADYGWVWTPANTGPDWRPYTEGHWVLTDENGWMWVSDTPYGWACDHYGRWYYDDDYGWSWVPDTHWGPAWVAWRQGEGCIGWAPLPPEFRVGDFGEHVRIDVSVDIIGRLRPHEWCFVHERDFGRERHYRHEDYLPLRENVTIINNTTNITNYSVVNNRVVNRSVDVQRISRVSGRTFQPVHVRAETAGDVRNRSARVEGGAVRVYQPRLEQRAGARPAPPPQIVEKARRDAPRLRERTQTQVKTLQAQGVQVEPRRREGYRPETTTTAPGARPGEMRPGVSTPGTRPGETRRPEVTAPGRPRTEVPPPARHPEMAPPATRRPEVTVPGTPRTEVPPPVTRHPEVTTPRSRQPEVTAPGAQPSETRRPESAAPRVEPARPEARPAPRVEPARPEARPAPRSEATPQDQHYR